MPDNLPGMSRDAGAGRPLTRVEFEKRERNRKALELWVHGRTYNQIKVALNLRSVEVARELVADGEKLWINEESGSLTRYQKMQIDDMLETRIVLMEAIRKGNLGAVDKLEKVWARLSRLLGLDAAKDVPVATGDTVIITGGNVNLIPASAGKVIDVRAPWDRPELSEGVVDGEVVAENDEGPPEGTLADDQEPDETAGLVELQDLQRFQEAQAGIEGEDGEQV